MLAEQVPLQVDAVTDTASLEKLRPEWEELWAAVPAATPFQSPAWLLPWWRHVGEGELLTFAVRDAGVLVGLFPFYVFASAADESGRRLRKLFPLGIATTDYLDALVLPGRVQAAVRAVSGMLGRLAGAWDVCDWPQLRPGSPLLELPAPQAWQDRTEPAEPCPALRLPGAVANLRDRVSRKTLRDLRTQQRRMAEQGGHVCEAAGPDSWEPCFEALVRLHAARWSARSEPGVLACPRVQAMHREALPQLLRAGLLRLQVLRHGRAVIAVLYGLVDPPGRTERRAYFYLGGFDVRQEQLSPGLILVGHAIEAAIAEGLEWADFLRGRETYKYFWGAKDNPTWRRCLIPCAPC
jgi:CelD/BcsL family acetyltransferase involved in cellulose biosynthesis